VDRTKQWTVRVCRRRRARATPARPRPPLAPGPVAALASTPARSGAAEARRNRRSLPLASKPRTAPCPMAAMTALRRFPSADAARLAHGGAALVAPCRSTQQLLRSAQVVRVAQTERVDVLAAQLQVRPRIAVWAPRAGGCGHCSNLVVSCAACQQFPAVERTRRSTEARGRSGSMPRRDGRILTPGVSPLHRLLRRRSPASARRSTAAPLPPLHRSS
jgi:hypothetical protein